jgi:predicted Zn-dependent peptidase
MFHIGAGVHVDKIEEALKVIVEELQRIKSFLVDPKELQKAKEYIKGRTTLGLEDNQSRLDWLIEQEAFHRHLELPKEMFAKIDKVTAQDVRRAAKMFFQAKTSSLAVIGPYKTDKVFAKLLKI